VRNFGLSVRGLLSDVQRDVRYTLRTLVRTPGFTIVAILTLALGIGVSAAIFSVVDTVLFKTLPYPEPTRLVVLDETRAEVGSRTVSWLDYRDWTAQAASFQDMAAYRLTHFTLTNVVEPTLVSAAEVSASFFPLLGAEASVGRVFTKVEDQAGRERVAVASHTFWRERLNGDSAAIGRAISLDGEPCLIVGVLPPRFSYFGSRVDLYTSVGTNGNSPIWNRRGWHPDLLVLARLRPQLDIAAARSEMDSIMRRMEQDFPQSNRGLGASVTPLLDQQVRSVRPLLLMLLGAVAVVLAIACANLANLVLARNASRSRELALRVAMGAGIGRIARQLVTEVVTLCLLGAATGVVLAQWIISTLVQLAPADIPRLAMARVDGRVLFVALAAAVVMGVLVALPPIMRACRLDVVEGPKPAGRIAGTGPAGRQLRAGLFIAEVALSGALAVAGGLLVRSLINVERVNPGFSAERALMFDVIVSATDYTDPEQRVTFFTEALRRMQTLPGAASAGASVCPPLTSGCAEGVSSPFMIDGVAPPTERELPFATFTITLPGYFRALETPLLAGRDFGTLDLRTSQPVAMINETFARRWWPHESPIGKRLREGGTASPETYREIVGVVADIRHDGLDLEPPPEVFFPASQFTRWDPLRAMTFVIKTMTDPMSLQGPVLKEIHAINRNAAVAHMAPLTSNIASSLARRQFATLLMILFATLALTLACIGVYGVMSTSVAERTEEIGIRIAIGANRRDVLRLVMGQGLALTAVGIGFGVAAALVATRLLASLLYGISSRDPLTFGVVVLSLAVISGLACYLPTRRAIRVDPIIAMRTG
jgi:putative ABC transport system permease protein